MTVRICFVRVKQQMPVKNLLPPEYRRIQILKVAARAMARYVRYHEFLAKS